MKLDETIGGIGDNVAELIVRGTRNWALPKNGSEVPEEVGLDCREQAFEYFLPHNLDISELTRPNNDSPVRSSPLLDYSIE